jgi:hypothetical protein
MKKHISNVLSLVVLIALVGLVGCNKDTVQSETERVKGILKGSWKVQSVSVDGTDQTALYKNLTLSFTDTGFTTTNGANVWPASGTWSFTNDTGKSMLRSDGTTITITEATATKLVLAFNWANKTIGPGRVESVSGAHVFTFSK